MTRAADASTAWYDVCASVSLVSVVATSALEFVV